MKSIPIGKGRKLTDGKDIAILSIGHPGNFAQDAIKKMDTENVSIAHYDMRFVKPLDGIMLHEIFSKYDKIITIEDGCLMGGFGSAIIEFMCDNNYTTSVHRLGIPDKYINHGTQKELWEECGFDTNSIIKKIKEVHKLDNSNNKMNQKLG